MSRDTQDLLAHSTSAIVCENVVEGQPLPPVALVTVDHCAMSNHLEDLLTSAGIACEIKALTDFDPANRLCVVLPSLGQSILKTPTSQEFDAIKKVLFSSRGVLWVTDSSSPDAALATGFVRSARNEGGGSIMVTFTLDGEAPLPVQLAAEKVYDVLRTAFSDPENAELEYIERQGSIMIPRMVEDHRFRDRNTATAELFKHDVQVPVKATIGSPGDLSSIGFEKFDWQDLSDNDVEVDVEATGLNFRDVMIALGQIPPDGLGCECAGIVSSVGKSVSHIRTGDRVIVVPRDGGCYSNRLRVTPEEVDIIPEDMPFEIAASLPITYLTAYWAVFQSARLQRDESVLIHAASGGLGQALINICHMVGATMFATVGSAEKKALLMSEFSIPEDNIFWSRGYGFAEGIMARTDHKGVDVVMNSLAGEALELSWSCLAPFGRFVELGKRDIAINSRLAMRNFQKNTTFTTLDASLELSRLGSRHKPWQELMDWYRAGKIRPPVPITTYGVSELELALRTMQSGKHVGKLVVVPREDEKVICTPATTKRLFRGDASYLLVGGLGGIGRALLSWMFENGARNFILASPSGSEKPRSQEAVAHLVRLGAKVIVFKCDVSNPTDVEKVLEASREQMPVIRGVIHAALVLKVSSMKLLLE